MKVVKSKFKFSGGVHPVYNKSLSRDKAIETLPMPQELVVLMSQHLGAPAKCVVKQGDYVAKGQLIGEKNGFISVCVHSPADGLVKAVEKRLTATGAAVDAVIIDTTAARPDDFAEVPAMEPIDWKNVSSSDLIKRIEECGISGMGGAGFPTSVKLNPPPGKHCEYLIINGAECEPYLTADFRVMVERAKLVRIGVEIIRKILSGSAVRIAVEENKPEAIEALREAFSDIEGNVEIVVLPVLYPQGSEKHQIYATVGRIVPEPPALPIDVGCVVENIGTVVAIAEAVLFGKPLYERVTTVSGDGVAEPKNVLAPVGTKYSDLVAFCAGEKTKLAKVISGGTMMGFAVSSLDIPTTKTSSGLLLLSEKSVFEYSDNSCINCGRCLRSCPMHLNPALMSKAIESDDVKTSENAHVMTCLECGACSFVCPAYRPLVQLFRRAKNSIRARMAMEKAKAASMAVK